MKVITSLAKVRHVFFLIGGAMAACTAHAAVDSVPPADVGEQVGTRYTLEELDQAVGLKGWNIPFFSYGNTLTTDIDGWRSDLAQYGVGVLAENTPSFAWNVLDVPRSNPAGDQVYWGQKASALSTANFFLTYDLGKIGLSNGQFQIAADVTNSTWERYTPTSYQLYRLAYYQSLLDKKIEFSVGYMSNALTFVGIYVGGQLQNPFGPSSSIPVELGLSGSTAIAPTAWIKYNSNNYYNQFGVQRSISPIAPAIYSDHQENSHQFRFTEDGTKILYIDELGYKQNATVDHSYTWVRVGGIYNTTQYHNYKTGGDSDNAGFYALADRQFVHFDQSTGRRGLYGGVSAMWAKPQTNSITQYYEARLYAFGPFASRPNDMLSLVAQHNGISDHFGDVINASSATTGVYPRQSLNSFTGSYTFKLTAGLSVTGGLQYTDHPSATYFKGEGSSLNVLAGLFIAI